jgi:hypothetical protein
VTKLLKRDEFRMAVLNRDGHRCVWCQRTDVPLSAHHILERRLFTAADDLGGYFLDNGATLCDDGCHLQAEQTLISCEELRIRCGIAHAVIPAGWDPDIIYDKWGNPMVEPPMRGKGPLWNTEAVERVLSQADLAWVFL